MLLSISFVPVKQITSTVPRSNFSEDDINRVADLILKSEGVINPLILRSINLESYEVIDGHFEYYAATRARELDKRKGEVIGAFILESNNQQSLEEQIKLLRQQNKSPSKTIPSNTNIVESTSSDLGVRVTNSESRLSSMDSRLSSIESRVNNMELRFENRINDLQEELKEEIKNVIKKMNEIENIVPKPMEPLEALNTLDLVKLSSKLKRINVKPTIIEQIVNERKNGKYTSFTNVVDRIKGLGEKTMLKIIDSFSEN